MEKKTSPSKAEVKKPVISSEMALRASNLREQYLSLTRIEQEAVTHFFNLHNNAGWIYNELMSDEGRKYIDDQVYYSQELAALERAARDTENIAESLDQMIQDGKDNL